jgi:hypothetical protein
VPAASSTLVFSAWPCRAAAPRAPRATRHPDLDAFDLEVKCEDPEKLVELLVALEPTFGGM